MTLNSNPVHPVKVLARNKQNWVIVAYLEIVGKEEWRLFWETENGRRSFNITDKKNIQVLLTEFGLYNPSLHDALNLRDIP